MLNIAIVNIFYNLICFIFVTLKSGSRNQRYVLEKRDIIIKIKMFLKQNK